MVKTVFNLAISFIAFIVLLIIGHFFLQADSKYNVEELNEGWDVYYNDSKFEDVHISQLRNIIGNGTFKGDTIVLIKRDVDLSKYVDATLFFESNYSAWMLFVDSRKVQSNHVEAYKAGKFIGCENNFAILPKLYMPVTIKLSLLIAEDNAYGHFEPPVLGGYLDVLQYTILNHVFIFISSAFLIIFGVIFFAIGVGFRSDIPEINMQIYSSLLFIVLGIWFLTQFKLLDLFIETYGHQTEIEYISLYMVVPFMYMTMGCMRNYLERKIFLAFAISGTIVPMLLIVLHFMGKVHINKLLVIYQLDAMVLIVFMFVMILLKDARQHLVSRAQFLQLTGQALLAASFIFNLFFYYLEVMGVSKQIMLSKKAVPLGAMCMVFVTLLNYYIFISDTFSRHREYQSLKHLAYADELTGLPNRAKYDNFMENLNQLEDDYCIISIDLNGLKAVNDNQGHLMGDKYLIQFGKVLNQIFGREGFVARIGGDEFVAILTGEKIKIVDRLITNLNKALKQLNRADSSIPRSTAVGYAFSYELPGEDSNSIYLLADERMYRNKQLTHGGRR